MITVTNITDFLLLDKSIPLFDVRSEIEYAEGHIPSAINLPLLNNEQRVIIGTCYKKEGKQAAVDKGFELVGPDFSAKIKVLRSIVKTNNTIAIYCWRGGLRSNIMAWLFSTAGFNVLLLENGYKAYRNYIYSIFDSDLNLVVLGGKTGSAKTIILKELTTINKQVICLETLANHRGSAFGGVGLGKQPTQEQFENNLAKEFLKLDLSKKIVVENESLLIGKIRIPASVYDKMRDAFVYELDLDFDSRLNNILGIYGVMPIDELIFNTQRCEKRLGNEKMREAVIFLEQKNIKEWAKIMLLYYDKQYDFSNTKREQTKIIPLKFINAYTKKAVDYLAQLITN